jgi:hypothetical protein
VLLYQVLQCSLQDSVDAAHMHLGSALHVVAFWYKALHVAVHVLVVLIHVQVEKMLHCPCVG